MTQSRSLIIAGSLALAGLALPAAKAGAAVQASLTTPAGTTATVNVTISITTALGTSTDNDIKTMASTGTASSVLAPNSPPFTATQANAMTLSFTNTTFNFQFFCLPFIGCQNLNVTVNNLKFELAQPTCSGINAATGAVAFTDALMHTTGDYATTGITVSSGLIDATAAAAFTGRVTSPVAGTVKLDQLAIANQTFVVPADQLPTGVTALTLTIAANLTNTTLSGPYARSGNAFDADADGVFDACDTCTDTDGDGYGNPGFPHNTCTADNCPDVANPTQVDTNGNGIGDACEAPPCPADVNANGTVNIDDLLAVINAWGVCAGCPADVNGNGVVKIDDLLAVINAWGACP